LAACFSKYFLQDADPSSHTADCFAHLGKNASAQGISHYCIRKALILCCSLLIDNVILLSVSMAILFSE
jgi:hypothetical protein